MGIGVVGWVWVVLFVVGVRFHCRCDMCISYVIVKTWPINWHISPSFYAVSSLVSWMEGSWDMFFFRFPGITICPSISITLLDSDNLWRTSRKDRMELEWNSFFIFGYPLIMVCNNSWYGSSFWHFSWSLALVITGSSRFDVDMVGSTFWLFNISSKWFVHGAQWYRYSSDLSLLVEFVNYWWGGQGYVILHLGLIAIFLGNFI